jgi:MFS transporter, DHA2 family, multidrug resistance protein
MEGQNATTASTLSERSAVPAVNPWLIAATVTIAAFMELLDTSIANVALPNIGRRFGAQLR